MIFCFKQFSFYFSNLWLLYVDSIFWNVVPFSVYSHLCDIKEENYIDSLRIYELPFFCYTLNYLLWRKKYVLPVINNQEYIYEICITISSKTTKFIIFLSLCKRNLWEYWKNVVRAQNRNSLATYKWHWSIFIGDRGNC